MSTDISCCTKLFRGCFVADLKSNLIRAALPHPVSLKQPRTFIFPVSFLIVSTVQTRREGENPEKRAGAQPVLWSSTDHGSDGVKEKRHRV